MNVNPFSNTLTLPSEKRPSVLLPESVEAAGLAKRIKEEEDGISMEEKAKKEQMEKLCALIKVVKQEIARLQEILSNAKYYTPDSPDIPNMPFTPRTPDIISLLVPWILVPSDV